MTHGGRRNGAGRKPGIPNKDRAEFISLIHKIGKPDELLGKLKELTNGVKCSKYIGEDVVIYEKPPDAHAITYLLDQAFGKAKQSVEVETCGKLTWEKMFNIEKE